MNFSKKLEGYSKFIRHKVSMLRWERQKTQINDRYEKWVQQLNAFPPDVFLGPDLPYGGVRGHVRAIEKYSNLKVQLVPDEAFLGSLTNFGSELKEEFMNFTPGGRPMVHSHVLPWMIDWCQSQQQKGSTWIHTYHLPYFPEHGKNELTKDQIEINHALIHQARLADVRLSVSRWQQAYLIKEHGIQTDFLPNGVDVRTCDMGNAVRFRNRFYIQDPFILYVGRNDPVKNPAEFVRLAQAMPQHRFVMVGGGLDADTLYNTWDLLVPPNLQIIGPLSHIGVQDALAACAALVVTSKREGLPTLVMEGMTHGKPVIVPDEPGCMEAVGAGQAGFIYPLGEISDLANTVELALKDRTTAANARRWALQQYDWRIIAPRLDAIYLKSAKPG